MLLQEKINAVLPAQLLPCNLANYTEGNLIVIVHSGAKATILRYQSESIMALLRNDPSFTDIRNIKVLARPAKSIKKEPVVTREISSYAASVLKTTAENLEDDNLRSALLKLSNRERSIHDL